MARTTRKTAWRVAMTLILTAGLTIGLVAAPGSAAIEDHQVTNVGDKLFTVTWISDAAEVGQVNWGTDPGTLDQTADDDRGAATSDDTHHITISGLAATTTYYYEIVSGGVTYDNGGAPYGITTGPGLAFVMPEMVSGKAYLMDGTTPAEGAIVYGQLGTASSQWLSEVVDASGTWALNIAPARADDLQTYFAHTDASPFTLEGLGGAEGSDIVITTVAVAKDPGAPDLVLVPNQPPTVANVTASQDAGTGIISIEYDVSDVDEEDTSATVSFQYWNGTAYVACTTVTGDGPHVTSTTPTHYTATWDAKTDFDGQYMTDAKVKVLADDGNVPGVGEGVSPDFALDTAGPVGMAPSLPSDGATDIGLAPNLTAVAATDPSGPITYNFMVATDAAFTVDYQESGWLSSTTWVPTTRLQAPEIEHWWKVGARDSFGNTSESAAFSFTTQALIPIDVDLVNRWNIIALVLQPAVELTASTMAADMNAQGAGVSQVFWWNAVAGSWEFWLVDVEYGTDFLIEMGEGYLLLNAGTATWTYLGSCPTFGAD